MSTETHQFGGKSPREGVTLHEAAGSELRRRLQQQEIELQRLREEAAMYRAMRAPAADDSATKRFLEENQFWLTREGTAPAREANVMYARRKKLLNSERICRNEVLKANDGTWPTSEAAISRCIGPLRKHYLAYMVCNMNSAYIQMLTHISTECNDAMFQAICGANHELQHLSPAKSGFTPAFARSIPQSFGMTVNVEDAEVENDRGQAATVRSVSMESSYVMPFFGNDNIAAANSSHPFVNTSGEVIMRTNSMCEYLGDVIDGQFTIVQRAGKGPARPVLTSETRSEQEEESAAQSSESDESSDAEQLDELDAEEAAALVNNLIEEAPSDNEDAPETQPPSDDEDAPETQPPSDDEDAPETQQPSDDEEEEDVPDSPSSPQAHPRLPLPASPPPANSQWAPPPVTGVPISDPFPFGYEDYVGMTQEGAFYAEDSAVKNLKRALEQEFAPSPEHKRVKNLRGQKF